MNYYIDFEATQFAGEIISIGCVREDGETFYSLVAPVDSKVTPFITNLTGITKEMLSTAMSPDEVFCNFYNWVLENDKEAVFYAWGNQDTEFVRHTFKRCSSYEAKIMLGYLSGSIRDISKTFCKKLNITACPLNKAYNALFNNEYEQTHNSLDDALMLFDVVNQMNRLSVDELREVMKEYVIFRKNLDAGNIEREVKEAEVGDLKEIVKSYPKNTVCRVNVNWKVTRTFSSTYKAARFVIESYIADKDRAVANIENVKKKIIHASNTSKQYFSSYWVIVE